MLYSMTGYGRGAHSRDALRARVELRAVNHRNLDLRVHLPGALLALETPVVRWCRERLGRGRVEARVDLDGVDLDGARLDLTRLAQVHDALEQARVTLGAPGPVTLDHVLSAPGLWSTPRQPDEAADVDALWPLIEAALDDALTALNESRRREGAVLSARLAEMLSAYQAQLDLARTLAPARVDEHRARLDERLNALLGDALTPIDPQRLATEVVMFADRVDVREELDRADAHLEALWALIRQPQKPHERVGKRLDFFCQELTREANTLASKSRDTALTRCAVEMKTLIESLREQAANIQ